MMMQFSARALCSSPLTFCAASGTKPRYDLHQLAPACVCIGPPVMFKCAVDHCRSASRCGSDSCNACRYMLLGQIWQKFYCVLTPREKIPGCVSDTQLLVFSKNGSDPVTSIMMTKAAAIEIPAKVAHDRACFELVTCQSWHHLCCQSPIRTTTGNEVGIVSPWSSQLLESLMGCLNKDRATCTGMGLATS